MSLKRSFLTNLSGVAFAQIVTLCAYPVISRLYTPADFGLFAQLMIITQLLSLLSLGQIHNRLPFTQEPKERREILAATHRLPILFTFLLLILISLSALITTISWAWFLLPFVYLSLSLSETYKMTLITFGKLAENSKAVTLNRTLSVCGKIFIPQGLYVGELIGNLAGVIYARKKIDFPSFAISWKEIRVLFERNRAFCFFYTLYVLSLLLNGEFLALIVSQKFDLTISGQFFLAQKLIFQVCSLLGSVISMTLLPSLQAGEMSRKHIYYKLVIALVAGSLAFGPAYFLPWGLWADSILGAEWGRVGVTLSYFVVLIPLKTLCGVFSYLLVAHGKTRFVALFRIIQFSLFLLASYLFDFTYVSYLAFMVCYEIGAEIVFMGVSRNFFSRNNIVTGP